MAYVFEDEMQTAPQKAAGRFVFEDEPPSPAMAAEEPMGWGEAGVSAVKNIPKSAYEYGAGMVKGVGAIGRTAIGAAEKLIPGRQGYEESFESFLTGVSSPETYKAIGGMLADRYGSIEAAKRTFATDPVGFAADVSTVLTAGGAAAGKIPALAGMGQKAVRIGLAMEPVTVASKALGKAAEVTGLRRGMEAVKGAIPPLSRGAVEKRVGEVLIAQTDEGPMYAKNAEEAARLEQKFPGLKFTLAQKTGQPEAIIAEQGLTATGAGAREKAVREVETGQAIRQRMDEAFPGEEGYKEVVGAAEKARREVERGREVAGISSRRATEALAEGRMVPEEAGATLYERLAGEKGVKATAKEVVREKFGAVNPKVNVQTQPIQSALDDIGKQKFGAKPEDYPSEITDFIKEKIQSTKSVTRWDESLGNITEQVSQPPKPITFGDTIEIRSQIADAIRAEKARGPLSNDTKMKRLHQLMDGVTETQRTLRTTSPKDFAAYTEAMKHYRAEYVPKIKQGATAKILSWKRTGDKAVDDAMIAGEYFKPGAQGIRAAQDFKRTFGIDEVATKALKDYAIQDMLHAVRNEATGEISTAAMQSWIHKNRPAIAAHGLWDEFRDFRKSRQALEKAQEVETTFNKGFAAKLLGVDPEKAISNVFTGIGKKDSARAAMELVDTVKDSPGALKGLQNATSDYILKRAESATKDIAMNPLLLEKRAADTISDLDPALRIIYRKNPSKLTALKEMRMVLDRLKLAAKNIPGGSQTKQREHYLAGTAALGAKGEAAIGGLVGVIAGEMLLPGIGGMAAGGLLGAKVPWVRTLHSYVKDMSVNDIEKLLIHAHFNPDVAEALKMASMKKIPVNEFRKKIYTATRLGAYQAGSLSSLSDKEIIEQIRNEPGSRTELVAELKRRRQQ